MPKKQPCIITPAPGRRIILLEMVMNTPRLTLPMYLRSWELHEQGAWRTLARATNVKIVHDEIVASTFFERDPCWDGTGSARRRRTRKLDLCSAFRSCTDPDCQEEHSAAALDVSTGALGVPAARAAGRPEDVGPTAARAAAGSTEGPGEESRGGCS